MTIRWVIIDGDGRWGRYLLAQGHGMTRFAKYATHYDTAEEANATLAAYERALGLKLYVMRVMGSAAEEEERYQTTLSRYGKITV